MNEEVGEVRMMEEQSGLLLLLLLYIWFGFIIIFVFEGGMLQEQIWRDWEINRIGHMI